MHLRVRRLCKSLRLPLTLLAALASAAPCALASTATTTTLALTSAGTPVSSVPSGAVVTLTASVKAGTTPVTPGQVNFCDATATYCTDVHLLATAQLTSNGTATFKFIPGLGTHSYKAVFVGTHVAASSSASASLQVTPATTTTVSSSGVPGNYTLSASVSSKGPAAPTGSISLLDNTNANYLFGTSSLSPGSFSPGYTGTSITSTYDGYGIAVADFNGDGIPDVASANGNPSVTIRLGNGDGTFRSSSVAIANKSPMDLLAADFNDDGIPDLAVRDQFGSVVILLGKGDGTFTQAPTPLLTNTNAFIITSADFNGDGEADLAVTTGSTGTIVILLGNGNGTFAPVTLPLSASDISFPVGDFNGDGIPDLVAYTGTSTLSILIGNGDGTFTQKSTVTLPPRFYFTLWQVSVADFNLDGHADLAVVNDFGADPLLIYLGKGDGTFTLAPSTPPASISSYQSIVADLNGDGIPDLAIPDFSVNYVYILLGKGDGTFTQAPYHVAAGLNETIGVPADFDGDGRTDLALSTFASIEIELANSPTPSTATVTGVSPVGTGTHLAQATYSGNTLDPPSTSNLTPLTAEPVPTTLAVTANPATTYYGQQVALTATLNPSLAQNHSASGTVTFTSNGNTIGTGTLTSGVASLNITSLPAGTDSLSATYPGDTNFVTSIALSSAIVHPDVVTSASLASSSNPSLSGQSVTFTATLSSGTDIPTGSVTFTDGASTLATVALNAAGQATYTTSTLALGTHPITATFTPTGIFATSYATLTQTVVTPYPTTSTLTCTPSSLIIGHPFTLASAVSSSNGTPTGSVAISDTGNPFATLPLTNGAATDTTSALTAGTHTFLATYPATGLFAASTATCTTTLSTAPTTTTLTSSLNPSTYGQSITFTSATTITGSATIPAGLIGFTDGTTLLATVALNASGQASYTTSALLPGTHAITATYSGSSSTAISTSPTLSQVVKPATITASLTTSPNPSAAFQPIQFSAQIAATTSSTAPQTLAGTVTFSTSAPPILVLGTAPINAAGLATLTTNPNLGAGFYGLIASFSGTATYSGTALPATATSPIDFQIVSSAPTSIALSANPTPVAVGRPVILTATLTAAPSTQLPTGSITFTEPATSTTLGTAALNTNGVATFTTSTLSLGTHQLLATFPGSINFLPSQSVLVTVTVDPQDFAVSFTPPTLTMQTLHTTSAPFTLSSIGLLADTIDLTCTNLPPDSTCSLASTPLTITAGQTITSSVNIVALIPILSLNRPASPLRRLPPAALAAALLPFTLLLRRRRTRNLRLLASLILSLAALNTLTGCTWTGYSPAHPAPGTYTLTLTATGRTTGITHTAPLTLNITP